MITTDVTHQVELLDTSFVDDRFDALRSRSFQVELSEEMRLVGDRAEIEHGNALYLNSSDSFRNLSQVADLAGASVLCVAGSGDFPLTFVEHGVSSLDVVDVSMSACFYAELKFKASQSLSFDEFSKMFTTHVPLRGLEMNPSEIAGFPIINPNTYKKIAPLLSPASKHYFDTILQEDDLSPLSRVHLVKKKHQFSYVDIIDSHVQSSGKGFVRMRGPRGGAPAKLEFLSSPYATNENRYAQVRQNASNADVNIYLTGVRASSIVMADYDYLYISNIGYRTASLVAQHLIKRGAPRVAYTCSFESVKPLESGEIPPEMVTKLMVAEQLGFPLKGCRIARAILDTQCQFGLYVELEPA